MCTYSAYVHRSILKSEHGRAKSQLRPAAVKIRSSNHSSSSWRGKGRKQRGGRRGGKGKGREGEGVGRTNGTNAYRLHLPCLVSRLVGCESFSRRRASIADGRLCGGRSSSPSPSPSPNPSLSLSPSQCRPARLHTLPIRKFTNSPFRHRTHRPLTCPTPATTRTTAAKPSHGSPTPPASP